MKIVFATHNRNKLEEIQQLVPDNIKLVSLDDLGLDEEIPETADTIAGNAIQKVEFLKLRTDLPIFADDTGLLVNALDGEPGVHTARYAGENKDSNDNMRLLLNNLEPFNDRSARFVTAIALEIDGCQNLFEGVCEGTIVNKQQGTMGFGYDPIFQPEGYDITFAEMSMQEKSKISHRAKAFKKLVAYLSEEVNKS
ncbi:non-canonical purine NTP pyrophosphatase, RdgB/HAM1 family [Nonlabens spongiae]|uniref:dITP/XTP pyrophosphatase n=1 Tax=Nonlabens spongiae TaxID=331648 RepID=A0A1W6MIK5_9FLAO|nr:RdgB/HAM1 family non-canonical purine NTP pyrophosphatase [Nonlabens spongiae]ARN77444.1 non-canonical purine NTP pyrophosphatase, RdgB/HAM1 family [Nonlabens spongiae]